MKKAIIVVGTHHSGKSKTINKYFKRLLNIPESKRTFSFNNQYGYILSKSLEERYGKIISQSLEEKGLHEINTTVERYKNYQRLILAARPKNEKLSYCTQLLDSLTQNGFHVSIISIEANQLEKYYQNKAKEIFSAL